MINCTDHGRMKWIERGDIDRKLRRAWEDGITVDCPHQTYDNARLDPETGTVILASNNTITTVLTIYGSTVYYFKFKVSCFQCGQHHHNPDECPSCGSNLWCCR